MTIYIPEPTAQPTGCTGRAPRAGEPEGRSAARGSLMAWDAERRTYVQRVQLGGIRAAATGLVVSLMLASSSSADGKERKPAKFRISSTQSFALSATVRGEWMVSEDRVDIHIDSVTFRYRGAPAYSGRTRFESFRASLGARGADGRWWIVRDSERLAIQQVMRVNEELTLDDIELSIPLDDADQLGNMSLIFAMENVLLDTGHGEVKGESYASSRPGIFRRALR